MPTLTVVGVFRLPDGWYTCNVHIPGGMVIVTDNYDNVAIYDGNDIYYTVDSCARMPAYAFGFRHRSRMWTVSVMHVGNVGNSGHFELWSQHTKHSGVDSEIIVNYGETCNKMAMGDIKHEGDSVTSLTVVSNKMVAKLRILWD